jgi:hypothetical protein
LLSQVTTFAAELYVSDAGVIVVTQNVKLMLPRFVPAVWILATPWVSVTAIGAGVEEVRRLLAGDDPAEEPAGDDLHVAPDVRTRLRVRAMARPDEHKQQAHEDDADSLGVHAHLCSSDFASRGERV